MDQGAYQCPSGSRGCLGVPVYSLQGCRNGGYMEFNLIQQASGVVIGHQNELTPKVGPNEVYKSILPHNESGQVGFRLVRMSCR